MRLNPAASADSANTGTKNVTRPGAIADPNGGIMNTKQWLNRARNIDKEINSLLKQKDKMRDMVLSITSSYDAIVVSGTKDPHKFDRLVELNEAIDCLIDRQLEIKTEIITTIGQMDKPIYQRILLLKYVDGMTFPAIAEVVKLSQRHVERLHGHALVEIGGIINSRV